MSTTVASSPLREAVECRDLLTDASPRGLRVMRITSDQRFAHSHIYMESPVFTPDSRRFIYQRVEAKPADHNMQQRWHEYWLCDIDDGFSLRRLTDEPNAIAPCVSPDGQWMYYFLNELDPLSRRGIVLMRVSLESGKKEVVQTLNRPLPTATGETDAPPSRVYSLSTIRADGGAVAGGCFIGDGKRGPGLWAVISCDIRTGTARVVISGHEYLNPHPQYARTTDPSAMHDLLIQQNINVQCDIMGKVTSIGSGCFVNVVKDDGTNFRLVPCGAAGVETCHGHQEWRGSRSTVIVGIDQPGKRLVVEAAPIKVDRGGATPPALLPGADQHRNDISRSHPSPQWGHTAFDLSGNRFAGDWRARPDQPKDTTLHIGTLGDAADAALGTTYLLHPRSNYTNDQATHPHPCLSPDGNRLLFNTDHGGLPQIWMVDGYAYP